MSTRDDLALLELNETLLDYCHVKNKDCLTCSFNNTLKLDEECPIDQAIELINKIKNNAEVIEMSKETEQEIAKRIYKISTQIENIKATQLNTEQLTAVIRSANAQVRHIERQKDELSPDEFIKACETVKDTVEKLDYWESRYKLVLDIMEEWNKDFIQLKADFEMLSEADGKTDKDAEYWKRKCIDINNDYIQANKALSESNQKLLNLRSEYIDLQTKYEKLTDEFKVNAAKSEFHRQESNRHADELMYTHDECNAKQRQINNLKVELERHQKREMDLVDVLSEKNTKLEQAEYNYKAISQNLEKVNAECEAWKQRYQKLNKKYDEGAVKFTNATLKGDAIALSYDELSDALHAVEQERDKYKEKYEVTKKLLDTETDTKADSVSMVTYNKLYTENTELHAELGAKEQQLNDVFREAKLLTETKVSLVSEIQDLKYLIHKFRMQDETPDTEQTDSCKLPTEIAAALPQKRIEEITSYSESQAKTELAKLQIQFNDLITDFHKIQQECGLSKRRCFTVTDLKEQLLDKIKELAEFAGYTVHDAYATAFCEDTEDKEGVEYYAD